MINNAPKLKTIERDVKHIFTPDEIAALNVRFGAAYDALGSAEADFESVKAVHKAKITEAESKMVTLRCTINAGFETREENCVVVYDLSGGKKRFYLESQVTAQIEKSGKFDPTALVSAITEELTAEDRQQELIDAENAFECKESIELFPPAGADSGSLIIGRQNAKWFTACRVTIGKHTLTDRLDSEQKATKTRPDAVKQAVKKYAAWLVEKLGKEAAKGFENHAALAVASHAEREE